MLDITGTHISPIPLVNMGLIYKWSIYIYTSVNREPRVNTNGAYILYS